MNSDFSTFHYPPEFLKLLIETVPLLCRSKKDVLLFFRGAGVDSTLTNDIAIVFNTNRDSISKYEIVRTVLIRLNERGDSALRERREIVKRIVEFESFSTCWPEDQLKARGLVAEISRVLKVKDSFTKMYQEREEERIKRQAQEKAKLEEVERRRNELAAIKADLFLLFRESDSHKRGKVLEGVLNRLFKASGILLREAFTVKGDQGEGIIEQIDGVAEINGDFYLVEMKWWSTALGPGEVSQHLVRVFNRGQARGIFISTSSYTEAAIKTCKESLRQAVVVLCTLEEIILLLEQEKDLKHFLKEKIKAAVIDKDPFYKPIY
ncbi:restriction endonuclease [Trichocoleus sp. ST-U3]|uniref:restriction endonuclease n=1 Tax=Coleofasciculus sp. FACHB-542 TaxID=2692787 RepID=UPI0016891333|nr:restriction endonuclease [Coleofasciculus sp. FACHB-542]MBD2088040.1 restriction endonuclease [Coleofasciculus sp. FACHB-542]